MKSSLFLIASSAALAMAGPIRAPLDKRVMQTDWVYEVVTVTVTAGNEPPATPTAAVFMEPKPVTTSTTTSTTSSPPPPPPPPPPPTTTSTSTTQPPPPPPPPTTTAKPTTTVVEVTTPPETTTTSSAPSDGDGSGSGSGLGDYENTVLDQHNQHRLNHSSPALEWSSELAQWAANTAETCVFAHDMSQGDGGYGQNLATWGSSGDISDMQIDAAAAGITMQWYNDEMENWSFYGEDNPPSDSSLDAWGHFTQVVWKSSTKVGCATQKCAAGTIFSFESWYTVCNYDPPGNFGGEYGTNVLKPLGQSIAVV